MHFRRILQCLNYKQSSFRNFLLVCQKRKMCDSTENIQTADVSKLPLQDVSTIREGKAEVYLPKSVFYNPVQEFNRDLTVVIISEFTKNFINDPSHLKRIVALEENSDNNNCNKNDTVHDKSILINESLSTSTKQIKSPSVCCDNDKVIDKEETQTVEQPLEAGKVYANGVRILEGLAASGLRSVRFSLEVPGVKEIIANDFDENAVDFIKMNIEKNGVSNLMRANCGDASMFMYENREYKQGFDVIDLDPYGSPARFLDGAVQAVSAGGLLCVTCTDTAVLCGNAGETCFSKYRAMSLRSEYCHEMALRIILQAIETHANCYSRYIEPLVSISADFYVRVFVRVFKGQGKVKQSVSKLAMVYHCVGCGTFSLQRLGEKIPTKGNNFKYTPAQGPPVGQTCLHCGHKHNVGGPIWAESIHNKDFLKQVLSAVEANNYHVNTKERIMGMLSVACEELSDVPLYYVGDGLCDKLHCVAPSLMQFRSALLNAGYEVSMSHCVKNSHKTNAPAEFIWDLMREWIKEHPVSEKRLQPGSVVKAILDKKPTHDVSFEIHPDANPPSRKQGLLRWQINPEPNWGPKPKAKIFNENNLESKPKTIKVNKRKHEKPERDLKAYPCKNLKIGKCELGDSCRYNHGIVEADKVKETE
ncbi:tRNA (guanine(26)-N(2))-dimethyltransferase [Octopus sinensis]|uniref:tRNA (guanine(26)-N(2))-dimethyltransferase n=1 Tax=Octopus sinensis TaxID=2607531 RepID=A0A6P7SBU9_9MOLL|nr:tRNA (guanine(26)-N(2))-dimethyltransferase [Octopus sinensis]XP_036357924.1 tRNA (guanine(26)-N(2))-dimethyltransferase [Octopus sinensis]XP_036357925.1 tRNA (guanine(26)-N(2))-dimethyltransferase [Octopus sinensis]